MSNIAGLWTGQHKILLFLKVAVSNYFIPATIKEKKYGKNGQISGLCPTQNWFNVLNFRKIKPVKSGLKIKNRNKTPAVNIQFQMFVFQSFTSKMLPFNAAEFPHVFHQLKITLNYIFCRFGSPQVPVAEILARPAPTLLHSPQQSRPKSSNFLQVPDMESPRPKSVPSSPMVKRAFTRLGTITAGWGRSIRKHNAQQLSADDKKKWASSQDCSSECWWVRTQLPLQSWDLFKMSFILICS